MDFQPQPFGFSFGSDGPHGGAPKAVRVEKAENGFVMYLRQPSMREDMRIATSLNVVQHILLDYFKTPVEVSNDHTTGTS